MSTSMRQRTEIETRYIVERTIAKLFAGQIDVEIAATIACDHLYYIDEVTQPILGQMAEDMSVFEMYFILSELWDCRDGSYRFITEAAREQAIEDYRSQLLGLFHTFVAQTMQPILVAC